MYLNKKQLAIVCENMQFALEHLTEDFTDPVWVDHYREDIDLLNKLTEKL